MQIHNQFRHAGPRSGISCQNPSFLTWSGISKRCSRTSLWKMWRFHYMGIATLGALRYRFSFKKWAHQTCLRCRIGRQVRDDVLFELQYFLYHYIQRSYFELTCIYLM